MNRRNFLKYTVATALVAPALPALAKEETLSGRAIVYKNEVRRYPGYKFVYGKANLDIDYGMTRNIGIKYYKHGVLMARSVLIEACDDVKIAERFLMDEMKRDLKV